MSVYFATWETELTSKSMEYLRIICSKVRESSNAAFLEAKDQDCKLIIPVDFMGNT